jgi:DNA-binding beta-propeller fold protein YncE
VRQFSLSSRVLAGRLVLWLVVGACVLSAGAFFAAAASAADSVYWANSVANKISLAALDGSGGGDLSTTGATVSNPQGIAFDPAAGRIYWANVNGNKISFANLDGSGGGDLITTGATVNGPVGVAVDPVSGRIYWANSNGNKISSVNLDGTGGADLVTGAATVNAPEGVAIDSAADRIYWANGLGNKISYAKLDGSGGGDLVTGAATLNTPVGVAVDPAGGRIYWANQNSTKISYANLDGSGGGDLNTAGATVNTPTGVAVDPAAGRIYWANFTGDKISFANLDGSGGSDLATPGATLQGATFPVLLQTPRGSSAPAVSSSGTLVGATLSCSQGTWTPDLTASFDYRAPLSFAYGWTQNGAQIAGATSNSIIAASPGNFNCQVTALNRAGSTTQGSAVLAITPQPQPQPQPQPPAALARLSALSLSPNRFRAASSGASITAKKTGATLRYTLNTAATVRFIVHQRLPGHEQGHGKTTRCVAPTNRNRRAHRCTRTETLRGSFTHTGTSGANRLRFSGRLNGHKLKPGTYTLVATPTASGRTGRAIKVTFRIIH